MSTQTQVKQWTNNIRSHADEIDKLLEWSKQPESETQQQLDYVLKCMGHLHARLHSITVKTGRKKSYAFEVANTMRIISTIKKEIKFWQTEGVLPEVLK